MLFSSLRIFIFSLVLSACATAQDFSAYYKAYVDDFKMASSYTTHLIERDGFHLSAREFKPKDVGDSHSPPLILMHGFPDSQHLYDRLAPLLARHRRVITFDFLGWGESDKPAAHVYDVASLRRDLRAVMSALAPNKATLVVHDSSGQPGIDFALDNAGRVSELILLNTYYAPSDRLIPPPAIKRFSTPGIMRDLLVWGSNNNDGRWQSGFMDQVGDFFVDDTVRDRYLPVLAHQAMSIRPAFFALNRVLPAEVAVRAKRVKELQKLKIPTKIIFGANDPYLNADVAREFNNYIQTSELYLVAGAGHYVQMDKPKAVAKLILAPFGQ